jgi:PAS domain S-box-containing protein
LEKDLIIKLLSSGESLIITLSEILRHALPASMTEFYTDFSSLAGSLKKENEEVVIIDCTDNGFSWKEALQNIADHSDHIFSILIISDKIRNLTAEILQSGACDVISDSTLSAIGPSVRRLAAFLDDRRNLKRLSRDKYFTDHIVNYSRSMISVIDRNYIYEKVNKTFCLNQKSEADKIVGRSLEDVWGSENFQKNIQKNVDKCFSGKVVYYQAFFETPAWGKRYYEVVFRPIMDDSNNVTHTLAETYDITDIKLKEQAASEIEWEFRNLESNLPIGFFRCDNEGRILHINKAFLRIMEMDNETEVVGQSLANLYFEKELYLHHLSTILKDGLASFSRVSLHSVKKKEISCRISAFSVHDGSGNQIYIDGAIEDFTREAELEKQLLQSQKLDTIGLLAGGIAHDFNTILTTIYGYSEMSLEGIDSSSEAYSNIRKIVQAVGRARSLTNQILTFSRQVGQERIPVKVADILLETTGFIRPTIPDSISLVEEMNDPEVFVSADPTQLYRVFLNLVNNAIQAMDNSGGRLTVSLNRCSGEKINEIRPGKKRFQEYAIISFSDTGPGMDDGMAERIFEPFFTGRKGGKGTGLGLSVVYGIISEVDGEITVRSKKGSGTIIDVLIPTYSPEKKSKTDIIPKARILLVPESDNETKVISIALANSGYSVKSTDPRGNWIAQASDIDIIIVVDNVINVTAAEILYEFSSHGIKIPVLLISDFESWLAEEKSLSSDSMRNNLFKPVSLKEIISSIDSLLNKKN